MSTQFTTNRDGEITEEAQLVTSEATMNNGNIMEGDTEVECSFYRGVLKGPRTQLQRQAG